MLLTCVFARSVWAAIGEALGKHGWGPNQEDELGEWLCCKAGDNYLGTKDVHTILLMVLWELWKHRNAIVFDGASPSVKKIMDRIQSECEIWASAGLFKGKLEGFLRGLHRWRCREE